LPETKKNYYGSRRRGEGKSGRRRGTDSVRRRGKGLRGKRGQTA